MVDHSNERTSLLSGSNSAGSSTAAAAAAAAEGSGRSLLEQQREEQTWTTKKWTINEKKHIPFLRNAFKERREEERRNEIVIENKVREHQTSSSLQLSMRQGERGGGSTSTDDDNEDEESFQPVRIQETTRRTNKIKMVDDEQTPPTTTTSSSLLLKQNRCSSRSPTPPPATTTTTTTRMRRIGGKENEAAEKNARIGRSKWAIVKQAVQDEEKFHEYQDNNERNSMIYMGQLAGGNKPINKWYRGLVVRQCCHSHLASTYIKNDLYMNTLSVALTAITSSAIFTSLSPAAAATNSNSSGGGGGGGGGGGSNAELELDNGESNRLALAAGCIAAFNTVLQAIMQTLQYSTRGEQHLAAYKQFTKLRFKLETMIGEKPKYGQHGNIDKVLLDVWIAKYEEALESSPIIPQRVFEHVASVQDNKKGGDDLKWTKEVRSVKDAEAIDAAAKKVAMKMPMFPGISRPSYF